ncbi:MAG TPA: hypothetical protein VJY62_03750 [Bacteroidia bacterium]|nr:hypothetical protein [Bacteroidia bacterium]
MKKSKPENNFPPLPNEIPNTVENPDEPISRVSEALKPTSFPYFKLRGIKCGCYIINYTPANSFFVTYDGTMRVECHSAGRTASGDLYQRPVIFIPPYIFKYPKWPLINPEIKPQPSLEIPSINPIEQPADYGFRFSSPPNPSSGIPIFSRSRYRYYLEVTQILEYFTLSNSFTLGFNRHRFDTATNLWAETESFTALMSWVSAPAGYTSDYLSGDVKDSSGKVVGRLTMGWVSEYLRKATIEIDRVKASEAPLNNGAGLGWQEVFKKVGWQINALESNSDLTEPTGESWSDAELHAAMLARRDSSNLDAEWRYHILAAKRLDSTPRGIMYDAYAGDSNNIPREGAAISSHWVIPDEAEWGLVRGERFGAASKPYFRAIVHETGHAMGLYHNTVDNGFMNTSDTIAASGTSSNPFPDNIKWDFADDDKKRLRHMPDVYVRPGGLAFGTSYSTQPISPTDLSDEAVELSLTVSGLLNVVPIGAPVRIDLKLKNLSSYPVMAPSDISLKSGYVSGEIIDPLGNSRTFSPLVLCLEEEKIDWLHPDQVISNSLTLLRGGEGALFPTSGMYNIKVVVEWDIKGQMRKVTGNTQIMVTGAVDAAHANAAFEILSTPDTLLTLVLGGDHLKDGVNAIQKALDNPVLRPHYAHIEAKRLAQNFGKRKADLSKATKLIDDTSVMSNDEKRKITALTKGKSVKDGGKQIGDAKIPKTQDVGSD